MERRLQNRTDGGRQLARAFAGIVDRDKTVVLALPRGGVPVGYEIARTLRVPLDVLLVHKFGLPGQDELAIGAVTSGGTIVLHHDIVDPLGISEATIDETARREMAELERREALYRAGGPSLNVSGMTVLLVDDGLTTGTTMRAAIEAVRHGHPEWVIVAVPVARRQVFAEIRKRVDDVVCAVVPEVFHALGFWYRDFDEVTDADICRLLDRANAPMPARSARGM
jgi:predicted phosphoribosyltransferase